MGIREKLRDYTRDLMRAAHEKGTPVTRPLCYDFPEDEKAWEIDEQYMYGPKFLYCPVLEQGLKESQVYLPKLLAGSRWKNFWSEET
jgi:alpha-D-xyloside xylohydrolase